MGPAGEFEDAQIERFGNSNGNRRITIATIFSPVRRVARYAVKDQNCTMAIQKESGGHVQILANAHYYYLLKDIAQMIRIEEAEIRKIDLEKIFNSSAGVKYLRSEGIISEVRNWIFFHGEFLLNGSPRNISVEPTIIRLEKIKQIVLFALDEDPEYPHRFKRCKNLKNCMGDSCPHHKYNLIKCSKIRRFN